MRRRQRPFSTLPAMTCITSIGMILCGMATSRIPTRIGTTSWFTSTFISLTSIIDTGMVEDIGSKATSGALIGGAAVGTSLVRRGIRRIGWFLERALERR